MSETNGHFHEGSGPGPDFSNESELEFSKKFSKRTLELEGQLLGGKLSPAEKEKVEREKTELWAHATPWDLQDWIMAHLESGTVTFGDAEELMAEARQARNKAKKALGLPEDFSVAEQVGKRHLAELEAMDPKDMAKELKALVKNKRKKNNG